MDNTRAYETLDSGSIPDGRSILYVLGDGHAGRPSKPPVQVRFLAGTPLYQCNYGVRDNI